MNKTEGRSRVHQRFDVLRMLSAGHGDFSGKEAIEGKHPSLKLLMELEALGWPAFVIGKCVYVCVCEEPDGKFCQDL